MQLVICVQTHNNLNQIISTLQTIASPKEIKSYCCKLNPEASDRQGYCQKETQAPLVNVSDKEWESEIHRVRQGWNSALAQYSLQHCLHVLLHKQPNSSLVEPERLRIWKVRVQGTIRPSAISWPDGFSLSCCSGKVWGWNATRHDLSVRWSYWRAGYMG